MKYYVDRGLRFTVTRSFVNAKDAQANLRECNEYLLEHPDQGVIYSSADNVIIIVVANNDKGTKMETPPEEPQFIRASPLHIREGNTIYVLGDDGLFHMRNIEKVLNPYDLFKGYLADDGCHYGLDGSYVRPTQIKQS